MSRARRNFYRLVSLVILLTVGYSASYGALYVAVLVCKAIGYTP